MKRVVAAVTLSTVLAIGTTSCAHQQLAKQRASDAALAAAVIAAVMLVALTMPCDACNSVQVMPASR